MQKVYIKIFLYHDQSIVKQYSAFIMTTSAIVKMSFVQAAPIMAGYLVLGIPCGLLCLQAGMNAFQVLLLSVLFYSGAGQYMIPNMWLAGAPLLSIVASVSLVNSRQILYATSLSRFCGSIKKRVAFLFAATVTDESFGVNTRQFEEGEWSVTQATLVNLFSQSSWIAANLLGVLVGSLLTVPTAVAAFAMTSIFLCLLFSQKFSSSNVIAALGAVLGVVICKSIGLTGPAIFIGALCGISIAILYEYARKRA